jgi:hypothetical protein
MFESITSRLTGGVRKADRTLLVTSTGNVAGSRRQSVAVAEGAVTQPAVRGVLNGAIARSRELRRQVGLEHCCAGIGSWRFLGG